MGLAVVRSLRTPRRLVSDQEPGEFERDLVDQFLLAGVGTGQADSTVWHDRVAVFEFIRFLARPVWTAEPCDVDRYLAFLRRERRLSAQTVYQRAGAVGRFFDFLITRYQGDIHALTGYLLVQPVDEFNRPAKADYGQPGVPPMPAEVEELFGQWRESLPYARKYLPAARDYFAASLRHFCASSLYEQGLDLKAIQEVLGDSWLSTTTHYIHVSSDHIERAWAAANDRVAARLTREEG
jgi:hypothetical protein